MSRSIRLGAVSVVVFFTLLAVGGSAFGQFGRSGGHSGGHSGGYTPSKPPTPHTPHTPSGPGFTPYGPGFTPHIPNMPYVPHIAPTPGYPMPNSYVPSYVPPIQPNPITPDVTPEANVLAVDLPPEPNQPWEHVAPVTTQQLEDWKKQTEEQTQQIIQQLTEITHGKIPEVIHQVHDQIDHGTLTPETVIDLIHKIEPHVANDPAKQTQVSGLINKLILNNRLVIIFLNININLAINVNAWWNFGIIIWIPVLPWGQVIILNNGWWFGGMGFGDDIWFDTGYLPQAAGLPYALGPPAPASLFDRVTSGVLLANGTKAAVNYRADSQPFTMQPDYRQVLPTGRIWTVSFDRGSSFGTATYGLTDGTYKFTLTERGLELFRHQFQVTVDNSANPFVFRYVLDDARQSLAAKQTQTHSGNYPVQIRFDDGAGQVKQKILETGTFTVAMGKDNKLDLFQPGAVTLPTPLAELTKKRKPPTVNLFSDTKKLTPSLFQTGLPKLPDQPAPSSTPSLLETPKK